MARGTRADATRHARPHGRTVCGPPKAQVAGGRRPRERCMAHVAGGYRTPVRGATWQVGWQVKGSRVSGPWLEVWGSNANALMRPGI